MPGWRASDLWRRGEHIEAEAEVRTAVLMRHAGHLVVHVAGDEHRQQRVTKLLHQLAITGLQLEWVARRQLDMTPYPWSAVGRASCGDRGIGVRQPQAGGLKRVL